MYEIIRPDTTEEWKELRTHGIGSSEIAIVIRANKWETPTKLWMRKRAQREGTWVEEVSEEQQTAFDLGHILEDYIAEWFSNKTGYEIDEDSKGDWIAKSDRHEWMQASPDRIYKRGDEIGILEIKTTHIDFAKEDMPIYYFCQLQYQMGIMGVKHGAVAWLNKNNDKKDYQEFDFNEEFFETMIEVGNAFWEENIIGGKEPEPSSAEELSILYPKSEDKSVEIDDDGYDALVRIADLNRTISELEIERDALLFESKKRCESSDKMTYKGEVVATYKSNKDSEVFDTKRFKEEHPEMVKQYMTKRTGARPFKLKI